MVTPNIEDSFDPTKCSRNEEVVLLSSDLPLLGDDIGCRSGEFAGGIDREEGDFILIEFCGYEIKKCPKKCHSNFAQILTYENYRIQKKQNHFLNRG